jgi:hypothetical protein
VKPKLLRASFQMRTGLWKGGFFFAVVDGKPLDYGGENGERDVELLMAIRGSAMRGGEPIDLP